MGAQTTWNNKLWGIINAQGKPWTAETFCREKDAQAYLNKEREVFHDLPRHRVVPVSVTVRVIKPKK